MAVDSSDFERFLYANYPDDYRRATAKDVSEDVLTAIISRHNSHYAVWKSIPEWIKNKYNDILPREVLNGNMQTRDFVLKETHDQKKEEKDTEDLLDFSVTLLAMGYSAEAVKKFMENRQLREELLKAAQGGKLNAEQMEQWLATRLSDKETILRDWQGNQPEKYLFHLMKQMSRQQRKSDRADTAEGRAIALSEKASAEEELLQMLPFFSKDRKLQKDLVSYLRQPSQQGALKQMSPEMQEMFMGFMQQCGIKVTPAKGKSTDKVMNLSREGLMDSLKQNFVHRLQIENLFKSQSRSNNTSFGRVSMREVLTSNGKEVVGDLFSKRHIAETERA